MKTLQLALQAWREAERRVEDAGPNVTPEMVQELACAKRRYQHRAAELRAQQRAGASLVPPDPYPEAATNGSVELGGSARAPAAGD